MYNFNFYQACMEQTQLVYIYKEEVVKEFNYINMAPCKCF